MSKKNIITMVPASPKSRKFARELGEDINKVKGSERGGRVIDLITLILKTAAVGTQAYSVVHVCVHHVLLYAYMYIHKHVCMYVCTYIHMYVCIHICTRLGFVCPVHAHKACDTLPDGNYICSPKARRVVLKASSICGLHM